MTITMVAALSSFSHLLYAIPSSTKPISTSSLSSLNLILNYGCRRRNRNHNHNRRFNFKGVRVLKESSSAEEDDHSTTAGGGVGDGETPVLADQGTTPNAASNGILAAVIQGIPLPQGEANSAIISACLVGLLTGFSVVLFNNLVHDLRDFFWDGVLYRGASWLREEPLEQTWKRTIFVPVSGGVIVALLNFLRDGLDSSPEQEDFITIPQIRAVLQQFLKSLAACVTLGTGNSLGPEGPSVEIGSSIGKGVASLFGRGAGKKVPLVAAGSAAGIASGWNSSTVY